MSGIYQVQSKRYRNGRWANERCSHTNRCAAIDDAKALLAAYVGKPAFRVRVVDASTDNWPPDVVYFQVKGDED